MTTLFGIAVSDRTIWALIVRAILRVFTDINLWVRKEIFWFVIRGIFRDKKELYNSYTLFQFIPIFSYEFQK